MFLGTRRLRGLVIAGRAVAATLLVAGTLVAISSPAVGAPDPSAPARVRPSDKRDAPPPAGVTPNSTLSSAEPTPRGARPKLTLRKADSAKTASGKPASDTVQNGVGCYPWAGFVGYGVVGYDQYLEEVADMAYGGGVDCDDVLVSISGGVGLVDRSPSFNGHVFNGQWLLSTSFYGFYTYGASGSGGVRVFAGGYDGARTVEPVIELLLQASGDVYWDSCGYVPGLYYYACDGLGTSVLHVLMGAGYAGTGLTQACRVQSVQGDIEQRRLKVANGSTPASTQILNLIPAVRDRVTAFKRDLCSTSAAGATSFATNQGQLLWDTAVAEAKKTDASAASRLYDDRPLYWARLSMTLALQQWAPSFVPDKAGLQRALDRASRGVNSHTFRQGTSKRVLVSGFDPFDLDNAIMRGNPSAAAVLGLDETTLNGAEVQVVIFPVRYADFNASIVEDVFNQHLSAGSQQATLITTVSQGRDRRFDLEYWNGRNRTTSGFPDNLNVYAAGSPNNPETPPYPYNGPAYTEFVKSTLPLQSLTAVAVPYPNQVCAHVTLVELQARFGTPQTRPDAAFECSLANVPIPTGGWLAVEGGGGGYLSNEIAYRVTALRDHLGSTTLPAGHVHVPTMSASPTPDERTPIVQGYRAILSAAIAATPGSGGTGGGDDGSLFCGEASCTPVQAAYISHFTGAGCTGTESYYTPYFGSDGIRRSWDGRGLVGTTLRTVTNRSWMGTDGQCHTDWPNGNTLSGFVTVYRCGEPTCTPVQAAYISHFTAAGCTGTESYYTPYFGSDGIRRSWDGRGVVGTTLRTVTNRSWKGTDGQCHTDWPNGNTLSGFVTIYR